MTNDGSFRGGARPLAILDNFAEHKGVDGSWLGDSSIVGSELSGEVKGPRLGDRLSLGVDVTLSASSIGVGVAERETPIATADRPSAKEMKKIRK